MTTITAIDMYTPAQTCTKLGLDEGALIAMVNSGDLAAYNLGGNIRFKIIDVAAAAKSAIAA